MKQYVLWTPIKVEWGYRNPITWDFDQEITWWRVIFTETPYIVWWKRVWYIEYDNSIISYDDLVSFTSSEPLFHLEISEEAELNSLLISEYTWKVSTTNFVFSDIRFDNEIDI